jgi:hypothetical protein
MVRPRFETQTFLRVPISFAASIASVAHHNRKLARGFRTFLPKTPSVTPSGSVLETGDVLSDEIFRKTDDRHRALQLAIKQVTVFGATLETPLRVSRL